MHGDRTEYGDGDGDGDGDSERSSNDNIKGGLPPNIKGTD